MNQYSAPKILIVDDDEMDVELIVEALRDGKLINEIDVVRDGEEALDYIFRRPPYADKSSPGLILLDINMPKKNGLDVLKEMKSHPEYKMIPVIMLTSSSEEADVLASYQFHANCYIQKPVDEKGFIEAVRSFESFWLKIVELPKSKE